MSECPAVPAASDKRRGLVTSIYSQPWLFKCLGAQFSAMKNLLFYELEGNFWNRIVAEKKINMLFMSRLVFIVFGVIILDLFQ